MKKCWLCGNEATTKEHLIKRTTIEKLMFNNPLERTPLKIHKDKSIKIIQSAKSDHLKFQKNLCAKCNNQITQPYDRAYECFFDYLIKNEQKIAKDKIINLKNLPINQEDLFKYFMKSFCCMVDSTQHCTKPALPVPSEIKNALIEGSYGKSLVLQFLTNGKSKEFPMQKIISVTDPIRTTINNEAYSFIYCESYGWLHIFYIYQNVKVKSEVKSILRFVPNYWVGKNKHIIIGDG